VATTTEVFKVEIGGTEKTISNLKEMKEAMSALKKEQETLALGSQAFTDNQKKIDDLNQSLKSLSDSPALAKLKTALKEAQNAALNGDGKAAKRVAELQNEINDLKDSVTTFSGSGLERARASFDMLKESFKNLDFGKLQTALKGLGSAFKALLPFAIIELVMYLKEHFEELSQGSGLLAKSLRFVADIISQIGDGLNWLTDNLKLTNTALDEMGENTVKNAEASKEALSQQNAEYDRQIAVAKAAGKSTVELEKAKQEAIIETNKKLVEQTIEWVRQGGVLDEEKKKLLTGQLEAIKNAKTQEKVIELNHQKEQSDKYKAHLDELKKEDEKTYEEKKKREKELDDYRRQIQKDWEAEQSAVRERFKASKAFDDEETKMFDDDAYAGFVKREQDKSATKEAGHQREMAMLTTYGEAARISTENQAQLTNFLFDLKRSKLQKGSAEELKVAKKQFQINKALAIQSTIISGIQGVVNALSAQSVIPEPYGTILKVITAAGIGVAAGVNVAKIASQQFNEGGGGGGGVDASTGNLGSAASASPPVPSINTPQNTPTTTSFDSNGKNLTPIIKTQVVETELTSTQRDVKRINEQSTF